MVIIFSSEKPLKFLLENGAVFTIRLKKRKYPREPYTVVSHECLVLKRGGRCILEVDIRYIGEVENIAELDSFTIEHSGFSSAKEWEREVLRVNKRKKFTKGYLYLVSIPLYGIVKYDILKRERFILEQLRKIKEGKK